MSPTVGHILAAANFCDEDCDQIKYDFAHEHLVAQKKTFPQPANQHQYPLVTTHDSIQLIM